MLVQNIWRFLDEMIDRDCYGKTKSGLWNITVKYEKPYAFYLTL